MLENGLGLHDVTNAISKLVHKKIDDYRDNEITDLRQVRDLLQVYITTITEYDIKKNMEQ